MTLYLLSPIIIIMANMIKIIIINRRHRRKHKSSHRSLSTLGRFPSASVFCQTFALLIGHRNVVLVSKDATTCEEKEQASRCLEKRVRAELDTEEGDVEMYLVKFPTKVTEYLRAQGGAAGGNPKPLVLGNFNIGPDGGAYLKLSNDVSNDLKGIDGIRMNKKIRAQPERIFWVNRDRSKVRLKGYIKHQYRGQYVHQDLSNEHGETK